MLLKFLYKFFNRMDISWVHLIWDNHYQNDKLPGSRIRGSFWWRDVVQDGNGARRGRDPAPIPIL